jgi:SAM-dependent methyltransferase
MNCVVCEGSAAVPNTLRADLVECPAYGLIYCPDAREDRSEFGDGYYRNGAYADYAADRPAIRRSAAARLAKLERMVHGRRLLDVGGANGYFLEAARGRGWEVVGLELSPYASGCARHLNLEVHEASILTPPSLSSFDLVTMWDTIEHLSRPDIALQNARRLLGPGGLIAVSTGDRRSVVARLYGRRWRLLDDATHKFFFDQATLLALLRNAGFKPIALGRPGK